MKKADVIQYYVEDVKYTISTKPAEAPKGWYANWTSKHLSKSDSAIARHSGKHNHA
jgi:hypothetical protein